MCISNDVNQTESPAWIYYKFVIFKKSPKYLSKFILQLLKLLPVLEIRPSLHAYLTSPLKRLKWSLFWHRCYGNRISVYSCVYLHRYVFCCYFFFPIEFDTEYPSISLYDCLDRWSMTCYGYSILQCDSCMKYNNIDRNL